MLPAPSKVGGCSELVEAVKVMDPCSLSRELLCAVVIVITTAQICWWYFMEPKLFLRWRATQMWSWGTTWWWWRPWLWRTCFLLLGSCSVPIESYYSSVNSALLISRTSLYLIFTQYLIFTSKLRLPLLKWISVWIRRRSYLFIVPISSFLLHLGLHMCEIVLG